MQHISKKTSEIRETTLRELKPVFQKIQLDYERELSELELKHQKNEAAMRNSFQNELQEVIEAEEKRVKSEYRSLQKHKEKNTQSVVDDIHYEYKERKANLTGIQIAITGCVGVGMFIGLELILPRPYLCAVVSSCS